MPRRTPAVLSPEARDDLAEIRRYFRRVASEAVSARVMRRIRKVLADVGRAPVGGAPRPEYGAWVRL